MQVKKTQSPFFTQFTHATSGRNLASEIMCSDLFRLQTVALWHLYVHLKMYEQMHCHSISREHVSFWRRKWIWTRTANTRVHTQPLQRVLCTCHFICPQNGAGANFIFYWEISKNRTKGPVAYRLKKHNVMQMMFNRKCKSFTGAVFAKLTNTYWQIQDFAQLKSCLTYQGHQRSSWRSPIWSSHMVSYRCSIETMALIATYEEL